MYKTKKQGMIQSCEGACLNHDVGEFVEQRETNISRAHFQGTSQRVICIKLPAKDRQKCGEDKVGRLVKSMYGTQDASHKWQLDYVNLMSGELAFEEENTVQCCSTARIKM